MTTLSAPPSAASVPVPPRRRIATVVVLGMSLVAGAAGLVWWSTQGGPPGPPSASFGVVQDRAIPSSVVDAPLVDQSGATVTLSSFRGRDLVVVPFLTSCQEECPLTTAALLSMRRDLASVGLDRSVAFVEVSVDPGRDTPARMAAYARVTGTSWPLLSGTAPTMAGIWRYFGVYYQQVPESSPAGTDWETGRPYTYDVDHSDGFILVDATQHERFATVAPVDLSGRAIPAALRNMLDQQGRGDFRTPPGGSWTVRQGLDALGWLMGRAIPSS